MPILSDFTVVNPTTRLLNNSSQSFNFSTGGRHNSDALLDVEVLGGFRGGDTAMSVRFRLNGDVLTTRTIPRWQDHSLIDYTRNNIRIPPNKLKSSGSNTLVVEPTYE
ncbi:MAG: hypothetical protein AAGD08_07710, partial [Pseudomonadota bacterium]